MNRAVNDPPKRLTRTLAPLLVRLARIAGWAGIVAITILSLVPGPERPHTGLPGQAEHFAAYACTGFALSLAYRGFRERLTFWAALGTASGVFEILQRWIPGRGSEIADVLVSTLGLTAGLLVGAIFARRSPKSPLDKPEERAEHRAQQKPRGKRKIKAKIPALDGDVARQMPQPEPPKPRPEYTYGSQNQP
jgi:VanZ family protein